MKATPSIVWLQQTGTKYDPSAIEEDLGDDPVKSSTYGMQNLRMILKNLDHWIGDEDGDSRKAELYNEILSQAMHYVRNVSVNVPGIYLYRQVRSRAYLAIRLYQRLNKRSLYSGF